MVPSLPACGTSYRPCPAPLAAGDAPPPVAAWAADWVPPLVDGPERAERLAAGAIVTLMGCGEATTYAWMDRARDEMDAMRRVAPRSAVAVELAMAVAANEFGRFDEARGRIRAVRAELDPSTRYLAPHVDYQAGLAAMAEGRSDDAACHYRRGLAAERAAQERDGARVLAGDTFLAELALERGASGRGAATDAARPVVGWFDLHAAAVEVAADGSPPTALDEVEAEARRAGRPAIVRLAAASRVSALVACGCVAEAERRWSVVEGVPAAPSDCLDPDAFRWRETEALAVTWVDVLDATGRPDRASAFLEEALDAAASRGLARMRMRLLARGVRVALRGDDRGRAMAYLVHYLEGLRDTGYARPLAREGPPVLPLLDAVADDASADPAVANGAATMRRALGAAPETAPRGELSARERAVLERLGTRADREIADELGLSYDGVRYYVKRLFAKLEARSRHDAVHKARKQGWLGLADSVG